MYYTDKKTDPFLAKVLAVAFPACKKTQYKVCATEKVYITGTYWSGGCRNSFVAVNLLTLEKVNLPHFNPPQFGGPSEDPYFDLSTQSVPVGIVELSNVGMSEYITFHLHPHNVQRFIAKSDGSVSLNEKIVLYATRSLKSSYGGISNYRFHEAHQATGITQQDWDDCIQSLIHRKLLRKNKSITPAGKNVVENLWSWPKNG